MRLLAFVTYILLVVCPLAADDPPAAPAPPQTPEAEPAVAPADPAGRAEPVDERRVELNLLGSTDTASGESRRNENVQFNLIDNNALKELNVRMGTTATIVDEFRADRNYFGVEFGNQPTGSIHLAVAKPSAFHGAVYDTHNNSAFSARSFFQAGGVKPAHENNYGATFGAPLWRGAFLFLDGGQKKLRGSVNGNILVPKAGERTPLATDPATRAVVARFLAAYPKELPNRTDINERALNTNSPQTINTDNLSGRIDQNLGGRDRLSMRYLFTHQSVEAFQLLAGQNPDTTTRAHTGRLTWDRAWSAETVTDFSIGFDRVGSLLVPEANAVGPSVSFGSVITDLGPGSGIPIDRAENRFRYAGQVRQVRGRHAWTAGSDVIRYQVNGSESSSHRGTFQFRNDFGRDSMTNFLMGIPTRYSGAAGNVHRGFRFWNLQFYAGDEWRVRPNLTLNYGLRYQPVTRPLEVNNLTSIPYNCDCNNFAPRFGFAYRLPGSWGLVRGAYGLHFGEVFPVTFQQLRFNPPLNIKFEIHSPGLVNPLAGLGPSDLDPGARSTVFLIPPDLVTPYSHQYNFSWEPFSLQNWKLQLGYVGSRSVKLLMQWRLNRAIPVPGIPQTTGTINDRRPDLNHFEVRQVVNGSRAYFDAARIAVGVPSWRGLSMDAAYWFSKAIDLGGNYTSTAAGEGTTIFLSQADTNILQDLKGPSAFDQSHAFLLHIAYAVPAPPHAAERLGRVLHNWNLSAVWLAKTGTPFTVMSGSDSPGFGNVDGANSDRPNVVDPRVLGRSIANPDTAPRLLPRSAFSFIAPTDLRGNLGYNTFRKAGIANLNAALSRTFPIGSDKSLHFRAESINFTNTPQFDAPGTDLTSPNFGQITNTLNDGRTFRFTLRFGF